MSESYRVCPECEEEYTLAAETCAECGVALVSPDALSERPEPEPFPEIDALVCVRVGPLPWTRSLSEGLSAVGIEHRVERDERGESGGGLDARRFGGETIYGTWVRPEDREAAARIDRALFAHLEPEAAGEAAGDDRCPACDEALPADALACPGCGLAFG